MTWRLQRINFTLGLLTGRLQRYVSTVKADIDRELRMDDMRKLEQDTRQSIMAAQSDATAEIVKAESAIKSTLDVAAADKSEPPA